MIEGRTKAAVDFLISDLLKCTFAKYKMKQTVTTIKLENDRNAGDQSESF